MGFTCEVYRGEMPNLGGCLSDSAVTVQLQGEVHNFGEIKERINESGLSVSGKNESEIIAIAYKLWGVDFFRTLNGAFALYILDETNKRVFLVRDHVGRVPLYYCELGNRFVFSSDLSGLACSKGFSREIDLVSLNFYLAFRYVPAERTIFKNVRRVLPGSYVCYYLDSGSVQEKIYWKPPANEACGGDEEKILWELESILEESVKRRFWGDKQPGAFLSGGLDSSLIVAFISKFSSVPIKTFIVGYQEKNYDETGYARLVADYFGTDHHELFVTPDRDHFIECISKFDEPVADPSIIPTSRALELAGANVDSVFSGDGADGLFLGFRTHRFAAERNATVGPVSQVFRYLKGKTASFFPREHRLRVFLEDIDSKSFFLWRNTVFDIVMREKLLKSWVSEQIGDAFSQPEFYASSVFESYEGTFSGKMGFFTYKSDPDDILYKILSLSVPLDLHVRTPFLDRYVVEFALGKVPADMKLRSGRTKHILKLLGEKYLPPNFPLERKRGFNPPLSKWLRGELNGFVSEVLFDGDDPFFDKNYIQRLFELNKNPFTDQTRRLFTLMVFKIWRMKYS